MTEVGQIHVGDMINVFRHGSLVMENLSVIIQLLKHGVIKILRKEMQ